MASTKRVSSTLFRTLFNVYIKRHTSSNTTRNYKRKYPGVVAAATVIAPSVAFIFSSTKTNKAQKIPTVGPGQCQQILSVPVLLWPSYISSDPPIAVHHARKKPLSSLLLSLPLPLLRPVSCEESCCKSPPPSSQCPPTPPPSCCTCPASCQTHPKPCTAEALLPKFGMDKCPSCSCTAPPTQDTHCQKNCPNKKGGKGCKTPVNWCETVGDLTHEYLVRQACQLSVGSVTRILAETLAAYQDYHDKYRCLLDALIEALESSRTAQGVQQELLDCKLIMMRAEVDNMKNRIVELESFMGSVQRLSDALAETAFLGHAEYASVAMSERVQSVIREMQCIKEESARLERDMIELQTVVIVESGKGLK